MEVMHASITSSLVLYVVTCFAFRVWDLGFGVWDLGF